MEGAGEGQPGDLGVKGAEGPGLAAVDPQEVMKRGLFPSPGPLEPLPPAVCMGP